MKTIKIYKRQILERTKFRNFRYKEITQFTVIYDGKEIKNHDQNLNNSKLRIPFDLVLETRSEKKLSEFIASLGRCDEEKWLKKEINLLQEQM